MRGAVFQMLRNRKCAIRTLIIIVVASAILAGCAGLGDWETPLRNDYMITRVNGHCITLTRPMESSNYASETVIPKFFISSFCYNDRYIGLLGVPTEDTFATDDELNQAWYGECTTYYLVDTVTDTVWGPFQTESEFSTQCAASAGEAPGPWLSTKELEYYSGNLDKVMSH